MSDKAQSTIRILVADDHPIVRDGLVAVLNTQPDFDVVGEVADGDEVLVQLEIITPHLLLLDLEMPQRDGVQTLNEMRRRKMMIPTIVFTAFDTDDRIVEAIRAGANGYLLKGAPREELFNAIRVVSGGGSLLQPVIATKLMNRLNQPQPALIEALTDREQEVLSLVAQGLPNKEIAKALVVTERTVKFHVSSILGKLGAGNRTEAVAIASEHGLLDP